jgi:hypothetical protein
VRPRALRSMVVGRAGVSVAATLVADSIVMALGVEGIIGATVFAIPIVTATSMPQLSCQTSSRMMGVAEPPPSKPSTSTSGAADHEVDVDARDIRPQGKQIVARHLRIDVRCHPDAVAVCEVTPRVLVHEGVAEDDTGLLYSR